MLGVLLPFLLAPPAAACGGFFCDAVQPVQQTAERIVFALDEGAGEVSVHVQVSYQGPSRQFAWVVPVPGVPEPFVSPDELFTALDGATMPAWILETRREGDCEDVDTDADVSLDTDVASDTSCFGCFETGFDGTDQVSVVAHQAVGPYQTVTLQATDASALIAWLQDHGYALPAALTGKLAPYVASGHHFLAIRLQKDKTAGDIRPIGFRYPGTAAQVPLVLTSVASAPDLRLITWVLGRGRAVPTNYLHVVVDEAGVDWDAAGANYTSLIARAADEAGGQAFATDYAGGVNVGRLWQEGRIDLVALAAAPDLGVFLQELFSDPSVVITDAMLDVLRRRIPMPAGVPATEAEFYGCVACFVDPASLPFDAAAFVADLDSNVVTPLREAEALLRAHTTLTRLTSSMSPDEMTIDPVFELAPSYPAVSNVHRAVKVIDCDTDPQVTEALRRLELADGRVFPLPPYSWLWANGSSDLAWLGPATQNAALRIERMFTDRPPEPVVDHTEASEDAAEALEAEVRARFPGLASGGGGGGAPTVEPVGIGCGCASTGSQGTGLGALVLLAVIGRRRRAS